MILFLTNIMLWNDNECKGMRSYFSTKAMVGVCYEMNVRCYDDYISFFFFDKYYGMSMHGHGHVMKKKKN